METLIWVEVDWDFDLENTDVLNFKKSQFSFKYAVLKCFLGGSVKNLPANAGDVGLIPDPGRFQVSEQLSQCSTTVEPVL